MVRVVQETLRDILQSVFEEAFGSSAMMQKSQSLPYAILWTI